MDALIVGATIEDLDLYDLDQWMAKITDEDILSVYKIWPKAVEITCGLFTVRLPVEKATTRHNTSASKNG